MDMRNEIESWFPNIVGKPYKIISKINDENKYNCVSYTLGINDYWLWYGENNWPKDIGRLSGIDGFKEFYKRNGYNMCKDGTIESGYIKIAFYGKYETSTVINPYPKHASLQYENTWRSKCGLYIIEHELDWLCGYTDDAYGEVIFFAKKKL